MIYRLRVNKRRIGLTSGSHYLGFHLGKRSWYFPQIKRLKAITVRDVAGERTTVTTYYKKVTIVNN